MTTILDPTILDKYIDVEISNLSGPILNLKCLDIITIYELKILISKKLNICLIGINLIFKEEPIYKDTEILSSYSKIIMTPNKLSLYYHQINLNLIIDRDNIINFLTTISIHSYNLDMINTLFNSSKIEKSKSFCIKILKINGWVLFLLKPEFQNDLDLIYTAICSYKNIVTRLYNFFNKCYNRDFIISILKITLDILVMIPQELINQQYFILLAIKKTNDARILTKTTNINKSCQSFILEIIKYVPNAILYCDQSLLNNKQFIINALEINLNIYEFIKYTKYFTNSLFIKDMIYKFPLLYAKIHTLDKKYLVSCALEGIREASMYEKVPTSIKNKTSFIIEALQINPAIFQYIPQSYKLNKSFIIKFIGDNNTIKILKYVDCNLLKDIKFILNLVSLNVEVLNYVDNELRNNWKFIADAYAIDNKAPYYASDLLLSEETFLQSFNWII